MISPKKWQQLKLWMEQLNIIEADIQEKFITGSGSGGQKINKTASCVYLRHLPTGFEIKCQQDRSRAANRYFARRRLCEKIAETLLEEKSKKQQLQEKIRRQKKRRSRRTKQKILNDKHHQADVKKRRNKPGADD